MLYFFAFLFGYYMNFIIITKKNIGKVRKIDRSTQTKYIKKEDKYSQTEQNEKISKDSQTDNAVICDFSQQVDLVNPDDEYIKISPQNTVPALSQPNLLKLGKNFLVNQLRNI